MYILEFSKHSQLLDQTSRIIKLTPTTCLFIFAIWTIKGSITDAFNRNAIRIRTLKCGRRITFKFTCKRNKMKYYVLCIMFYSGINLAQQYQLYECEMTKRSSCGYFSGSHTLFLYRYHWQKHTRTWHILFIFKKNESNFCTSYHIFLSVSHRDSLLDNHIYQNHTGILWNCLRMHHFCT